MGFRPRGIAWGAVAGYLRGTRHAEEPDMKVATAAYSLDPLKDWAAYAAKLEDWVSRGAETGAEK